MILSDGDKAINSSDVRSRDLRLTKKPEFDAVFKNARRSADAFFTVLYKHNGLLYPRLGFVVAKKNIPRAVARNRIRRLTRESFRHSRLAGVDVVVLARAAAGKADNPAIFASLDRHWKRLATSTSE